MGTRHVLLAVWMMLVTRPICHGLETKTITCKFQGDWCGYRQDPTDDFDWSGAHEDTPKASGGEPNEYISACRNTTGLPPGSLARLISPIYEVTAPSLLSLQFRHFKTEGDGSRLRVSVQGTARSAAAADADDGPAGRHRQPLFRPLLQTHWPWATYEGKTDVVGQFQLVIEAEVGFFSKSHVAIDDIILALYSYPVHLGPSNEASPSTNASGARPPLSPPPHEGENDALTSWSHVTPRQGVGTHRSDSVIQEKTEDADEKGVSLCFVLAVMSSSLLVIVLVVFVFVVLSLTKRKRRYQRFTFGHDYEEIRGKGAAGGRRKGSSASALALTQKGSGGSPPPAAAGASSPPASRDRPNLRLTYHNRHTAAGSWAGCVGGGFARIHSLSSCLSRTSGGGGGGGGGCRDSLRSSLYAEIAETDQEPDNEADLSDQGIGNSTTMTTTCTATWDICSSGGGSSSSSTASTGGHARSSRSDVTVGGTSDLTGRKGHHHHHDHHHDHHQHQHSDDHRLETSQNDSGWVENIIYERTSDYSLFGSAGPGLGHCGRMLVGRVFRGFGRNETPAAACLKPIRQRVHTV